MNSSWVGELFKALELSAGIAEQWLDDVSEVLDTAVAEVDQWFMDFFEPLIDVVLDLDETVNTTAHPFIQTVNPVFQDHPVCTGCRHYHGETYGGNLLICAMHPYGAGEPTCPDWESIWEGPSS